MADQSASIDNVLLSRVAAGDELAFRSLFAAYHQQVGAFVFRITDSMEMAEEVVQDVFLKIWLNRNALSNITNFRAYLFVASKNHALNCLKKIARERVRQSMLELELPVRFAEGEENQYYDILDQAINQLPPQQQKVYLLSRHQRLKYAEIAEQLNISHETVKRYLQIATTSIHAFVRSNMDLNILLMLSLLFF